MLFYEDGDHSAKFLKIVNNHTKESNVSPMVIPATGFITTATLSSEDPAGAVDTSYEIRINTTVGIPLATINTLTYQKLWTGLSIPVTAGDLMNVYAIDNGGIKKVKNGVLQLIY